MRGKLHCVQCQSTQAAVPQRAVRVKQDKTIENRPFSSRGDNLLGKNKLRGLPGGCIVILPGIAWQGRGSTVSVQGWESTDTPPPGVRAVEGSSRGWAEARELCRAQL